MKGGDKLLNKNTNKNLLYPDRPDLEPNNSAFNQILSKYGTKTNVNSKINTNVLKYPERPDLEPTNSAFENVLKKYSILPEPILHLEPPKNITTKKQITNNKPLLQFTGMVGTNKDLYSYKLITPEGTYTFVEKKDISKLPTKEINKKLNAIISINKEARRQQDIIQAAQQDRSLTPPVGLLQNIDAVVDKKTGKVIKIPKNISPAKTAGLYFNQGFGSDYYAPMMARQYQKQGIAATPEDFIMNAQKEKNPITAEMAEGAGGVANFIVTLLATRGLGGIGASTLEKTALTGAEQLAKKELLKQGAKATAQRALEFGKQGVLVEAINQIPKAILTPKNFDIKQAAAETALSGVSMGILGAASKLAGEPAKELTTNLLGRITKGRLNPYIAGLISSATGGAATGSTATGMQLTFEYLKNPEQFNADYAKGEIAKQAVFFAGLDTLFNALGGRPMPFERGKFDPAKRGWKEWIPGSGVWVDETGLPRAMEYTVQRNMQGQPISKPVFKYDVFKQQILNGPKTQDNAIYNEPYIRAKANAKEYRKQSEEIAAQKLIAQEQAKLDLQNRIAQETNALQNIGNRRRETKALEQRLIDLKEQAERAAIEKQKAQEQAEIQKRVNQETNALQNIGERGRQFSSRVEESLAGGKPSPEWFKLERQAQRIINSPKFNKGYNAELNTKLAEIRTKQNELWPHTNEYIGNMALIREMVAKKAGVKDYWDIPESVRKRQSIEKELVGVQAYRELVQRNNDLLAGKYKISKQSQEPTAKETAETISGAEYKRPEKNIEKEYTESKGKVTIKKAKQKQIFDFVEAQQEGMLNERQGQTREQSTGGARITGGIKESDIGRRESERVVSPEGKEPHDTGDNTAGDKGLGPEGTGLGLERNDNVEVKTEITTEEKIQTAKQRVERAVNFYLDNLDEDIKAGKKPSSNVKIFIEPSTKPIYKLIEKLGEQLGIKVVFFSHTGGAAADKFLAREFIDPNTPELIFLNKNIKNPFMWSFGHGWIHTLRINYPQLYRGLHEMLDEAVTKHDLDINEYIASKPGGGYKEQFELTTEQGRSNIIEELLADMGGNFFATKEWWMALEEVAELTGKRTIFNKVFKIAVKIVDKVLTFTKQFMAGPKTDIEAAGKDLHKVYLKIGQTLLDVAKEVEKKRVEESKANRAKAKPKSEVSQTQESAKQETKKEAKRKVKPDIDVEEAELYKEWIIDESKSKKAKKVNSKKAGKVGNEKEQPKFSAIANEYIDTNRRDEYLRRNGLIRSKKFGVGKEIGSKVYVHKQYEDVFSDYGLAKAKEKLPANFKYNAVAYDTREKSFTFTHSPDFDYNPEPIVGEQIKIYADGKITRIPQRKTNPQIWHHKWLWVKDDYKGFDVEEAKDRSYYWTRIPNINKSKIGNYDYWQKNVVPFIKKETIGEIKKPEEEIQIPKQEITSAGTSVSQISSTFRNPHFKPGKINIDIGAGKYDRNTAFLAEKYGTENIVYDPFNRDPETNRKAVERLIAGERGDTATVNNVLNVIPYRDVRLNVIKQAAKAIKPDGKAYFLIYEGDGSGIGKQTKKDSWQNNLKAEAYIPEISQYFNKVKRVKNLIIAEEPKNITTPAIWRLDKGEAAIKFTASEEYEKAPIFYSQLERVIQNKGPGKALPGEWLRLIHASDSQIKEEEIKWSGIEDYLRSRPGHKITKQEILDYLKANDLDIQEIPYAQMYGEWEITNYHGDKSLYSSKEAAWKAIQENIEIAQRYYKGKELQEVLNKISSQPKKIKEPKPTTKYGLYVLPGGENYREILFTFHNKIIGDSKYGVEPKLVEGLSIRQDKNGLWNIYDINNEPIFYEGFKTKNALLHQIINDEYFVEYPANRSPYTNTEGHWSFNNVFAHTRLNDRITPDNQKVLFIEEIQSDWHQQGRKEGYLTALDDVGLYVDHKGEIRRKSNNEIVDYDNANVNEQRAIHKYFNWEDRKTKEVPDAPYKKSWHEFVLRRLLRLAAEEGYDRIAWTTGDQQNERYGLGAKIDKITAQKVGEDVYLWAKDEEGFEAQDLLGDLPYVIYNFTDNVAIVNTEYLPKVFGEELANKILKQPDGVDRTYRNLGLEIGKKGMREFYDKILVDYLNKYAKKWNTKVENIKIETDEPGEYVTVHSLPITDNMKKSVLYEGQPKFTAEENKGKSKIGFEVFPKIKSDEQIPESKNELREKNKLRNLIIEEQIEWLKEQGGQGVEQGYLIRDKEGYVTDRVGRISRNPEWYQKFMKDTNYAPKAEDWRELAIKTLREGIPGEMEPNAEFLKIEAELDKPSIKLPESWHLLDEQIAKLKFEIQSGEINPKEKFDVEQLIDEMEAEKKKIEEAEIQKQLGSQQIIQGQKTLSRQQSMWVKQQSMGKGKRLSSFAVSTLESPAIDSKTRQKINEEIKQGKADVDRISNAETMKKAEQLLHKQGVNQSIINLLNNKKPDHVDVALGIRVMQELGKQGQHEKAADVAFDLAHKLTEAGRTVQAASIISRITPQGILIRMIKSIDQAIENVGKKEEFEEKVNILKTEIQKVNEETVNTLIDMMRSKFDSMSRSQKVIKIPEDIAGIRFSSDEKNERKKKRILKRAIKEEGIDMAAIVRKHYTEVDATGKKLAEKLVDAGLMPGEAEAIAKEIEDKFRELATEKKQQILKRLFKDKSKNNKEHIKRKTIEQKFIEHSNLGALNDMEYRNLVAEYYGFPKLDEATAKRLTEMANWVQEAPNELIRLRRTAELVGEMNRLMPVDIWQKIASLQYTMQLLNPKTLLVRNPIGNEMLYRISRADQALSSVIDWGRSNLTGQKREIVFTSGLIQRNFWRDFKEGFAAGMRGVNIQSIEGGYSLKAGLAFNPQSPYAAERAISILERITRATIKGFDYAAYNRAFLDCIEELAALNVINKYGKLDRKLAKAEAEKIYNDIDMATIEIADDYAKWATFQDANYISQALVAIKQGANKITGGKEWGLGNIILNYPKVTGSLIARALEYSPLGFVHSLVEIARICRSKELPSYRKVTQALSRALIGTIGLTGLGYYLAANGIITGRKDEKMIPEKVKAVEESEGIRSYQINISAMMRFIVSGFDKKAAEWKKGDLLYSYDWAQPLSMSLAIGANLYQALKKQDYKNLKRAEKMGRLAETVFITIPQSLESGIESIVEQPTFTSIQNMLTAIGNEDFVGAAMQPIAAIPASFMPTLGSQIRMLFDNTTRIQYSKNKWEALWMMAAAKMPLLSSKLPARYNVWGEPKKNIQTDHNPFAMAFQAFLSPGWTATYQPRKSSQIARQIYAATMDTKGLPNIPPKSGKFTAGGKVFTLTPKEQSMYQKYLGEYNKEIYKQIKGDTTISEINTIMDKARKQAQLQIIQKRGIKAHIEKNNIILDE